MHSSFFTSTLCQREAGGFYTVARLRNSYVANEFDLHFQIDFDQISDCLHDNLSDAITHDDWSKLL